MIRAGHRPLGWSVIASVLVVTSVVLLLDGAPSAQQQPYLHLNPVIEKLTQGKHVIGVSTSDLSLANARSLATNPNIDYVYLDMEHNPLDFAAMQQFLAFLAAADRGAAVKRGNAQAHPAVFARFPPIAPQQELWIYKHAMDMGLMGILGNNTETKEQAEAVVRTMRPVQRKDAVIPLPIGARDSIMCGFWGVSGEECRERSDLWPLNPRGDMLYWPMIENKIGEANAAAIAKVPGVSGFYLGALDTLTEQYGVTSTEDPEVLAAMNRILSACKANNIPCGGTVNASNVAGRIDAGYRILNLGGTGGFSAGNMATLQAATRGGAKR